MDARRRGKVGARSPWKKNIWGGFFHLMGTFFPMWSSQPLLKKSQHIAKNSQPPSPPKKILSLPENDSTPPENY